MSKNYLLLFEIGPIYDFTRHARKTVDTWSASFVFSYIMCEAARTVKGAKGEIFIPFLDNGPLYSGNGVVSAGSIPDRIYAVVVEDVKEKVLKSLEGVITDVTNRLANKIEGALKIGTLDHNEIKRYFNFFHVLHKIDGAEPTRGEFSEAEQKILMRSELRPFDAAASTAEIDKWDKCSLCGDRTFVHVLEGDKGVPFSDEKICSVCMLKRYLPDVVESIVPNIDKRPRYQSTSDIAAIPLKNHMTSFKALMGSFAEAGALKEAHDKLINEYKTFLAKTEPSAKYDENSNGRCYFEPELKGIPAFRDAFKRFEDEAVLKDPGHKRLRWLDRPFYAVVYMDGDNMGTVLKGKDAGFAPYIRCVSRVLTGFANDVGNIVSAHGGQLVFAGGEDITFIIHPEQMLDCIGKLCRVYNGRFASDDMTKADTALFTLSAGASVCYHKYPLGEAIRTAYGMLKKAKSYTGPPAVKNATAISLVKGHTEAVSLVFSNYLIRDLIGMRDLFLSSEISRTTPYRIKRDEEIIKKLDNGGRSAYIRSILAGTRGEARADADLNRLADHLMRFCAVDCETMINAMLYARFLAGDK